MSNEFKTQFEKIMSQEASHRRAASAVLHFVLPIALTIMGASSHYLWELNSLITVVIWFFIIVIYGLFYWKINPTYDDVHHLLLQKNRDDEQIHRLEKEVTSLEEILKELYFKNMAAFSYRVMSLEYIKNAPTNGIDRNFFSEILNEILSPFYLQGDIIFGFNISECWSIGVYIHDGKNNVLKSVWREKSISHPSQGLGRDWIPGEGHVGKAFIDRRPISTGNANDEAVAQLCKARGSKQESYDDSAYISFASVPIVVSEDDDDLPHGVLVVTSNFENRFSEESTTELLMHAAQTIALILDLTDSESGCLINPNHCTKGHN